MEIDDGRSPSTWAALTAELNVKCSNMNKKIIIKKKKPVIIHCIGFSKILGSACLSNTEIMNNDRNNSDPDLYFQ